MTGEMEARPRVPRSGIVWVVVALVGSILILLIWSDLYTRLVAILVFLEVWGIIWRVAVGIHQRRWRALEVFLVQLLFATVIGAIAARLSLEVFAAGVLVFVMFLLTLAYLRFGRPADERERGGPKGFSRRFMRCVSSVVLGYLAVLLVVGSRLTGDVLVAAVAGFFVLYVAFMGLIVIWGRQRRARAAAAR